jgi:CheY-like chemotaxis protein
MQKEGAMANRSALVIDDSKSARFALRRYLEGHAYVVDTADSAETAFTYLQDHQPGVIFLDHVMPGVDGFDVLRTIKSNPRTLNIPVVICSSNEGELFTQEARSKGAADVLPKPPSSQQLARVLGAIDGSLTVRGTPEASIAQTAAPAAKSREDALLERLTLLFDGLRAQLLKVTQDIGAQIGELKSHVARLEKQQVEVKHLASAFGRRRADAATTDRKLSSPPPRVGGRRKLPRV